jgi:hypothetical protein
MLELRLFIILQTSQNMMAARATSTITPISTMYRVPNESIVYHDVKSDRKVLLKDEINMSLVEWYSRRPPT